MSHDGPGCVQSHFSLDQRLATPGVGRDGRRGCSVTDPFPYVTVLATSADLPGCGRDSDRLFAGLGAGSSCSSSGAVRLSAYARLIGCACLAQSAMSRLSYGYPLSLAFDSTWGGGLV